MIEKTPVWEDILIIASVFTLWPVILHRETPAGRILLVVTLAALIWVFVRRLRRFNRATHPDEKK